MSSAIKYVIKRCSQNSFRVLITIVCCISQSTSGNEIQVAVASNFSIASVQLAEAFEAETGYLAVLNFGSTGKHYAQIKHGAPIDVLLAADSLRPQRLEEEGLAIAGSRVTYALGRLVLWSPVIPVDGESLHRQFTHLAMANEKLAPYGVAAKEYLKHKGIWETLQPQVVRGENVGQALLFVRSGNAELGLIAQSQVLHLGGFVHEIPVAEYPPVIQQAVLITGGGVARAFLGFLLSMEAMEIIESHGYALP